MTVRDDLGSQPLPTIGQALTGAVGVMVQQSTYGQASPFLRGLTGYHVLNLIDGVRFNNSTFRSGPNQYIALVDPSQMQIVEAMLGPSSSQFGSDSMGGTIQLLTPSAQFVDLAAARAAGSINLFAASADRSGGSDAAISVRASNAFLHAGGTWRELNDLRAGGGRDSHHVLTRLFGLEDEEIQAITGSRQVGTGFSQSGVNAKLAIRVGKDQNLTAWYQGSELSGVRGYKDLWGGLGRAAIRFRATTPAVLVCAIRDARREGARFVDRHVVGQLADGRVGAARVEKLGGGHRRRCARWREGVCDTGERRTSRVDTT